MAVIRTSLSLITFGFTIFQLFDKLQQRGLSMDSAPARHFGEALVALGVGMLLFGIGYHVQFMLGLRKSRAAMRRENLIYGESTFPPSLTLITATILLIVGITAILSMVTGIGPF
jgi:putative membrane protein